MVPEKTSITMKSTDKPKLIEKTATYQFLSPSWGSIRSSRAGGHE
jgi:hypothetical protein